MSTVNHRVATYLPPVLFEQLSTFKQQRSIPGDSQALITILSEYFGIAGVATQFKQSAQVVSVAEFEQLQSEVAVLAECLSEVVEQLQQLGSAPAVELPDSARNK